jgi:hypothetical protein
LLVIALTGCRQAAVWLQGMTLWGALRRRHQAAGVGH